MNHRLIYLVGAPGAGKSTLMARLTEGLDRTPFDRAHDPSTSVPAHDVLTNDVGAIVGAELGSQRGAFSGTDTLPASIIDKAVPWLDTVPYPMILAEGARLANRRFLLAATGHYQVTVAYLDHPEVETWREHREVQLGRRQSPSWVKGRTTATANLMEALLAAREKMVDLDRLTLLVGHPDQLYPTLAAVISGNG